MTNELIPLENKSEVSGTYAQKVSSLYKSVQEKFGEDTARKINAIVRSSSRLDASGGLQVIDTISGVLSRENDPNEFSRQIEEIFSKLSSEVKGGKFIEAYDEATLVDTRAKEFVHNVVPTLEGAESAEVNGQMCVSYTSHTAFAKALEAIRPSWTLSFAQDALFGLNQQLSFSDGNNVVHEYSKMFNSDAAYNEQFKPLYALVKEELNAQDSDGFFRISKTGELFACFLSDSDDEERKEKAVENWQKAVSDLLGSVSEAKKSEVALNYFNNGDGGMVLDLQIGKKHITTQVSIENTAQIDKILTVIPEWVARNSMDEALVWLKTLNLVKN